MQRGEGRGEPGLQSQMLLKERETTFVCATMSVLSQIAYFTNLNLVLSTLVLLIFLNFLRGALSCQLSLHGELVDCTGGPQGIQIAYESGYFQELVTTGKNHACAIRHMTGRVVCWRTDSSSVMVEEVNVPKWIVGARSVSLGKHHSCAIWGMINTLTCWGSDDMVLSSSPVNVSNGVRMLAEGHPDARHMCFLRESTNDVSCFGSNEYGQIGLGMHGDEISSVAAQNVRPD